MYKYLLLILLTSSMSSQVGIGIGKDIQGVFHIDPLGNTTVLNSLLTNDSDDMVYNKKGFLGIGTSSPANKLAIVGDGVNSPLNIKNIKNFDPADIFFILAIDNDKSDVGLVNFGKIPVSCFILPSPVKGLDIGSSSATINIPINTGKIVFNKTGLTFGLESDNRSYFAVESDGIYAIDIISNYACDTNKIWGMNLVVRKKPALSTTYSVVDSRRIVTKLDTNINTALPGRYSGVFILKKDDRISLDIGTGFVATGVLSSTCGSHKPAFNTSTMNFIIKKIN